MFYNLLLIQLKQATFYGAVKKWLKYISKPWNENVIVAKFPSLAVP